MSAKSAMAQPALTTHAPFRHVPAQRALKLFTTAMAVCALELVRGGQIMAAEPERTGRQVYEQWCSPCHSPGPDYPGTTALAALYRGAKPAVLEERTDLTPAIVKEFVRKGVSVMPFFRKTEISDAELEALAAYLTKRPPG